MATPPEKDPEIFRVKCERATQLVLDYLAGELDPALSEQLEIHLQRCKDCVAFFNTYQKTIQTTRSLKFESIPSEMQNRLLTFLKNMKEDSGKGKDRPE